jgi:hypothetical protein
MTQRALHVFIVSLVAVCIAVTGVTLMPAHVGGTQATASSELVGQVTQTVQIADEAPRGRWDTTAGSGEIILDSDSYYTVFQGEDDIDEWRDVDNSEVTGTLLEGESGATEGEILELTSSISTEQPTGRYSSSDLTVRIQEPRISRVTLLNQNGAEISSNVSVRNNNPVLVKAEWNYVQAEDLQIELVDQREDLTVENEVLAMSPSAAQSNELPATFAEANLSQEIQGLGTTGHETAYWLLDFDNVDDGTYTLRIEGSDSLTTGDAAWETELTAGERDSDTPTEPPAQTPTETPPQTETVTDTDTGTETASPSPASPTVPTTPTATTVSEAPQTTVADNMTSSATTQTTTTADGAGFGILTACLAALLIALGSLRTRL